MFPFHPIEEDKAGNQTKEESADDHEDGDDGRLGAAHVAGVPDVVLGQARLAAAPQTGVIRAHGRTRWVLVGESSLAQLAWWEGFCHLKVMKLNDPKKTGGKTLDLILSDSESEAKQHLFRQEVVRRFDGATSSQSLIPNGSSPSTSIGIKVP